MTSTDICNLALSYISGSTIQSIDENTEVSRKCKQHYEHTKKMALQDFNWGFAKRQEKLALVDGANVNQYDYAYIKPENCLQIRRVYSEYDQNDSLVKHKYDVYSLDDNTPVIVCDVENAYIEYTYDIKDAAVFTSQFIEALARYLASNLAMPIVGNTAIQQGQYQLYQIELQKAKRHAAKERDRVLERPNSYVKARWW